MNLARAGAVLFGRLLGGWERHVCKTLLHPDRGAPGGPRPHVVPVGRDAETWKTRGSRPG
ncbi:hypothetical protein GCM10020220_087280 [Nonomuraea rubra]